MKLIMRAFVLVVLCVTPALSAQDLSQERSAFKDLSSKKAWHAHVEQTERGYRIGNPEADAQLIMFTSYTCEGCHDFAFKGDPELDLALLAPGILNLEIRQRIHNPLDLAASLLSRCGAPDKFKVNHAMFMRAQDSWMDRWNGASAYNRAIWSRDSNAARSGLVSALDFDDMMARRRGYSRMDLGRCLTDRRAVADLRADHAADTAEFALPDGETPLDRPFFALNGVLLEGVRDWDALYEVLSSEFKPEQEGD